jgi:hypothetical protein
MSKRDTLLDKTIKALDKTIKAIDLKIAALELARKELLAQRNAADLAAARPPKLKTVNSQ